MALTNNIITMYMVHTLWKKQNKKTLLHYNNLCTRLLYQHQKISERTTAAKMLRKKISKGWHTIRLKNQHLNTVETFHQMSTDCFKKFPLIYGIKNDTINLLILSIYSIFITVCHNKWISLETSFSIKTKYQYVSR